MAKNKESLAERRRRVWDLRTIHGLSQQRIAEEVNVSQATVHRDLSYAAERAVASLDKEARKERIIQYYQLQNIVDQSLQAWEKSKLPQKKVSERKEREVVVTEGSIANDEQVKSTITSQVTERLGSTAYLTTAMNAMSDIRDLLNIKNPQELIISWEKELDGTGLEPALVFESLVQSAFELLDLEEEAEVEDETA